MFLIIPRCSKQLVYCVCHTQYTSVCACVQARFSSSCQMVPLPENFSLSVSTQVFVLFRPLIIEKTFPSPPLPPSLPAIHIQLPHLPLSLPSPLRYLSLIIQQLEATSQPYVSENCHLTLLAFIIASRLPASSFALNPRLFFSLLKTRTN